MYNYFSSYWLHVLHNMNNQLFIFYFRITSPITISTNSSHTNDNLKFYLTVYGCLAGANSIFTLFRAFLFAYGGICAAKLLHHNLLDTILKVIIFTYYIIYRSDNAYIDEDYCEICFSIFTFKISLQKLEPIKIINGP